MNRIQIFGEFMKILHLISQDSGGAGRAALRLHKALLEENIESLMLVQNKSTDLDSVLRLAQTKPQKIMEKLRPALNTIPLMLYPKRHKDIFSPNALSNKTLIKKINEINPDILHIHWINNGFLNIKDLKKIKIPMIWSLHDANAYTGGCHYVATACVGVKNHCMRCPLLKSNSKYDLSFWTFKAKKNTYKKINLTINGLSRWITNCAKDSALLKDKTIINLPNPIDTNIFKPINKQIAREILGLNTQKKIITFGAIDATNTDRKGYNELINALKKLDKKNIRLIIFGASHGKNNEENIEGIETIYLGHLHDDLTLRIVYSLSDVIVVPSKVESFGQVALESLSCGTPVVAFDTSGLRDIIDHKKSGYLAKCYDVDDLANGIKWVIDNNLDDNPRLKAMTFDSKIVSKKYIAQYQNILNGGGYKELLQVIFFKQNTLYITFGAISGTNVARKGYSELIGALKKLDFDFCLLVFGSSSGEILQNIPTHFLGYINDDTTLNLIYNASDIFITPSLAENLSNAIMESLSCGTPVVAFDIGGNSDMIDHKKNGYLAKENDIDDLANGIKWAIDNKDILSQNAIKKIKENFKSNLVAKKYIAQYQNILNGGGN